MAKLLNSVAVFVHIMLFTGYRAFILCQEVDLVYIGTGTNGSYDIASKDNRVTTNSATYCSLSDGDIENSTSCSRAFVSEDDNEIIIVGGLFAIHKNLNDICTHSKIFPIILQDVEAMVLAVDKINRDENLLPGITLAYEIRDTCMLPNLAVEQTVLSLFVPEKGLKNGTAFTISGVVGTSFSSVSLVVANLLHAFKVPQISYSATSKLLDDNTMFEYFFRMVPPDTQQALVMANIITHFNWSYIIGIYSDDEYGFEGTETLFNLINSERYSNVCSAEWVAIKPTATAEVYDKVIADINEEWTANATVVILFCHQKQAESLFEAVLRRQATDKEFVMRNITWIGSDSWGKSVSPKYYNLVHGMLSTIPRVSLSEEFDKYFLSLHPSNNSANPWFNEYWEEIFNCSLGNRKDVPKCDLDNQIQSKEDSGYYQNNFLPFVIDAVYAFAHAIHNMQQDHCPEQRGLCPEIVEVQQLRTALNGELLLKYLRNVSFNGTSTERVRFNEKRYQQNGYDIFNLQVDSNGEFSFVKVGEWDNETENRDEFLLINGDIQWSHGLNGSDVPKSVCSDPCAHGEYRLPGSEVCCWQCIACKGSNQVSNRIYCQECKQGYIPNEEKSKCILIEPTFISWSHPFSIIIIILAVLGLASTTFVAIVFIVNCKHHLIKASSRELTGILISGIALCYVMPFFYLPKPSPVICGIQRFGVGFCFSLCFSALLVKTNRIHRIFNRNSASVKPTPLISPLSQLFFTFLLVSVQVVIVIVWLAAERPSIKITYNNKLNAVLVCGTNPYIGLSVSLAYNAILLVITTYFSIRTRKVPENFNEAKFINLNMYTLCILWLAFIPSYFITAALNTSFHTSILLLADVLSGTVILFYQLVPRVYFLFLNKKKEASVRYQSSTRSSSCNYTSNKVHFDSNCTTPVVKTPSHRVNDYTQVANIAHRQLDDTCSANKVNLSIFQERPSLDGIDPVNQREKEVNLTDKSDIQGNSLNTVDLVDQSEKEDMNDQSDICTPDLAKKSKVKDSSSKHVDIRSTFADQADSVEQSLTSTSTVFLEQSHIEVISTVTDIEEGSSDQVDLVAHSEVQENSID